MLDVVVCRRGGSLWWQAKTSLVGCGGVASSLLAGKPRRATRRPMPEDSVLSPVETRQVASAR